MDHPPVVSIHTNFLSSAGWRYDLATGYLAYCGMIVLWYRTPGAETLGFQVTLPWYSHYSYHFAYTV
jgi:hypothetical protein